MSRRSGSVLCLALTAALSAAGGQRPVEPDVPAPPVVDAVAAPVLERGASADGEPGVELTLAQALTAALAANPSLEVERTMPLMLATEIAEAWSAFDPRLEAGARWEDATNQLSAVQSFTFRPDGDGGGGGEPPPGPFFLSRETVNVTATAWTRLPTGTGFALTGTLDRSDTNFTPREYEGTWSLELSQALLEGFGREVNLVGVRQAANRTVAGEWQLRRAVLEVVAAVEVAYWELVLAQEVVAIREFGVRLAAEQLELNRDLTETGRAVRSAVLSAEAEESSRRADLAAARGQVRALSATLERLLDPAGIGRATLFVAVDEPRVEPVAVDAAASVDRALELRPELYRDRAALANRELDVVAARDRLEPRLDLTAGYGRSSLGPELGDAGDHLVDDSPFDRWWLGLGLELPLVRRGDRARLERARLGRLRAEAVVDDTASRVVEEVRRAAVAVETERARVEATAEAVAARREELRIERDRYQVGMARNLDVLLVQRLLIQAEVDAAAARVDLLQALAELYRAEGTLLERRRIVIAATAPAGTQFGGEGSRQ